MRIVPILVPAILPAAPAAAHVGHLGDLAGHDHWVAGAALGGALLAGALGVFWAGRGRGRKGEPEEADASREGGAPGGDDAPGGGGDGDASEEGVRA